MDEQQPTKPEPACDLVGLDYIRALDEEEQWSARNQVVTKEEHKAYFAFAQDILNELVDGLPLSQLAGRSTEDEYMSQFSNADFQGSASQFDVDYLERLESSAPSEGGSSSSLARESLYVKFDPLVGRPSPDSVHKQRTPPTLTTTAAMGSDLLMLDTPPSVNNRVSRDLLGDLSHSTPEMTGTLIEVESCDYSDPNNDIISTVSTVSSTPQEVLKYSEEEVIQLLEVAREKAAEQEEMKHAAELSLLQRELAEAQTAQEVVLREVQSCQANDSLLQCESTQLQNQLEMWKSKIVSFEESESLCVEEHERVKREISRLEQQRDHDYNDYNSLEGAYDDLYQRFLKLRESSEDIHKANQAKVQSISRLEESVRHARDSFASSNQQSEDSIDKANIAHESLRKELGSLLTIEKANSKKVELQMTSLEREIQAAEKEKQDLSQICEELLKTLGVNGKS